MNFNERKKEAYAMSKWRKVAVVLAIVSLMSGVVMSGCASGGSTGGEAGGGKSSDSGKKETITMFMGNSGLKHPDGVDPSDNPYIQIIEDYANVDLQLEVPNYTDFKTKFDLLLASGKLPDIVHSWYPEEAEKVADQGAFIDLKKYYDKSPTVQKYITPEMMELAKSQSGHYYRIPMAWDKAPQGSGLIVRYDLVEKYNAGKWPESVPEWIDLMRKIHRAEPDSIVFSNRVTSADTGLAYGGTPIYYMYGALPYSYRVQNGTVVSTFELPEYREATSVMKQLYDEGILDKEFATTDSPTWSTKWTNKNVLMQVNGADQLLPAAQQARVAQANPITKDWKLAFAPPLTTYPSVLADPKYAMPSKALPINGHGLYIAASAKDPDRAWKVIEGFASDQLHEAIFWGKEGDTYTVQDGKRIPNAEKLAAEDRRWVLQLAIIFGFVDGQDVKLATAEQIMGKDYLKFVTDSLQPLGQAAEKTGYALSNFVHLSDEASKKASEMRQFITKSTVEAIMGKIAMSEFDQRVKEFHQKYGFIYDEYTKYLKEHKDELLKKGVVEAGW